jgi:hypothetical protein
VPNNNDELAIKDLSYGFLNPIEDRRTGNSTDRRRSGTGDFLRAGIDSVYATHSLEGVDEFRGIVVQVSDKEAFAAGDREAVLDAYVKRNAAQRAGRAISEWWKGGMRKVYKVYIPELECRPVPYGFDDPIITTYYDVYMDNSVGMLEARKAELGSVVTVKFSNTDNFADPRIIRVGKTVAFHGINPTGNQSAHRGGNSLPAGQGRGERRPRSTPGGGGPAPRPATAQNICRDAVTGYTPGPNAEDLRAWMVGKPIREKVKSDGDSDDGPQLDNGGDLTADFVKFAKSFLQDVIDEIPSINYTRITGGNDAYHHCPPCSGRSRHCYGDAMDITIHPTTTLNKTAVNKLLYEYSVGTNAKVLFKNEYSSAQTGAATSGGHFHIEINGRVSGWRKTNYDDAVALERTGAITGKDYA